MPAVIPSLLTPYVLPATKGSLTLVLSVLDATTNWLLLRYIYAALNNQDPADKHSPLSGSVIQEHQENIKVLFVSILRGFEQWREMSKKVVCMLLRCCDSSNVLVQYMPAPSCFLAPRLHFIEAA
jgi:elongator complex protein 6